MFGLIDNIVFFNNFILDCFNTILGVALNGLWFLLTLFVGKLMFLTFNYCLKNKFIKLASISILFIISIFITIEYPILLIILARS